MNDTLNIYGTKLFVSFLLAFEELNIKTSPILYGNDGDQQGDGIIP
ncbi:hypothetical protein ES703_114354 [subsurface metagenome]